MKNIGFFLLALFLVLAVSGCEDKGTTPRIPDEYTNWKSSHDNLLQYPIPGHMDNFRKIYFSKEAESIGPGEDYPNGTIIIKEIYKNDSTEKPFQLTVMVKDETSQDALGGWVWIVKNTHDNIEHVIKSEFCFTCHTDANVSHPYGDNNPQQQFRDYVFLPLFAQNTNLKN